MNFARDGANPEGSIGSFQNSRACPNNILQNEGKLSPHIHIHEISLAIKNVIFMFYMRKVKEEKGDINRLGVGPFSAERLFFPFST